MLATLVFHYGLKTLYIRTILLLVNEKHQFDKYNSSKDCT